MLVSLFVHGIEDPFTKEVCSVQEMSEYVFDFGIERLDKIVITDFRPICKDNPKGEKVSIYPDFGPIDATKK